VHCQQVLHHEAVWGLLLISPNYSSDGLRLALSERHPALVATMPVDISSAQFIAASVDLVRL
jgi:hypothetical protein